MRMVALFSWLLSALIILIEVLFFFNKLESSPLHEFLIDQRSRSYFTQTVSHNFCFLIDNFVWYRLSTCFPSDISAMLQIMGCLTSI